ncbi:GTP 3',8-cyclase MoaA [Alteromonas oceanisediminis]|uniref:GTP 3',8-cyclase MoaA n=1 Tax=Alteromonas oceanisediminis TaxID=2836180 RepID=UPI001BDA3169|nr:GTP 3',8-cyclase MoaA [Alteromonas oceanisediminis]MBT0587641.1 GTP 3',8-cyclase MoaA [Alteromonas oceanisediminis]
MLNDSFGRRFHYLRLSITDVCNYRCDYCLPDGYQGGKPSGFLSPAEIETVVGAFASLGTHKIRLTGGEPSLRKDVPDIIQRIHAHPDIHHIGMTTNGFSLEKSVDTWADCGLDSVNISIDSLDPKMFNAITGHNHLPQILRGIDRALSLGIKVKVNVVLMKTINHSALQRFLAWIKALPITLRFIELMQTGDNQRLFDREHVSGQPIKARLLEDGWLPFLRDKAAGPAEEFYHTESAGRIGLIMPYSKDFCASCNRLRLSATGKLHLCLFAEQGLDLRDTIRAGDVDALASQLEQLLGDKQASHYLDAGFTGATQHLAMIGG